MRVTERRREAVTADGNLLQPGRGSRNLTLGRGGSLARAGMKEENTGSELGVLLQPL